MNNSAALGVECALEDAAGLAEGGGLAGSPPKTAPTAWFWLLHPCVEMIKTAPANSRTEYWYAVTNVSEVFICASVFQPV
ncbi:MAG: hypothetical protein A2583_12890 [Bdellovibrionales bacterium RIFOXYD1_FULL_53_11]|nr:MAG: hypothetical protein A2583_12890 [Bdellovibrionales bacterium RIFOXYD1_FULL_53_11]